MYAAPTQHRRKSKQIMVGNIAIGGDAAIAVQSMTNTPSDDIEKTQAQIDAIINAGADLVRVSCPDKESTKNFRKLVDQSSVPLIADIHFHYQRAIEAADQGAACLRINPGNIADYRKLQEVVQAAKANDTAIRVGVNGGSFSKKILQKYRSPCPEAFVESAMDMIAFLEDQNFTRFKISVKASNVQLCTESYRQLAKKCDYPLHIGITEAGGAYSGLVKSAVGLGSLLLDGIGDTMRVSLSDDPVNEVRAAHEILKSLGMNSRGVTIISCPSCARQQFDVIPVVQALEERLAHIADKITISIIGCVVNGPGEAKISDIGLTGGHGSPQEIGTHQLYLDGQSAERIKAGEQEIIEKIVNMVEEKCNMKLAQSG